MQTLNSSVNLLDLNQTLSGSWTDSARLLNQSAIASTSSAGDGLKADYFNNRDFTNLAFTRIDPTVNFNWGNGAPDARIDPDTFSVRWSGEVLAPTTGTYTFFTTSDDGVRLFVNNQLIVDYLRDQSATERSGRIDLIAGERYSIRLDYYDNRGQAISRLAWSAPNLAKQIIPQSQLSTLR